MGEKGPPYRPRPGSGLRVWLLIGAALVIIATIAVIWALYLSRPPPLP